MNYTIEKIATLIGARRIGSAPANISWLLTDSRSLRFPESTLFFALKTSHGDGHRYIEDLYRRGVRNFVIDYSSAPDNTAATNGKRPALYGQWKDANFLVVTSTLAALQRLAERHRDEFALPVVGITGSNGKTIVKEWLYQLLMTDERFALVTRSPRSYNSQIGVPLSLWLLNEQSRMAIFEAGISQPGEMVRLHDIIQPTIGVFTALGLAHQDNFRSMEEKCEEKLELMKGTKAMIYPSDNDVVSRAVRLMHYNGERLGWSLTNDQAPMYVTRVEPSPTDRHEKVKLHYIYKGTHGSYTLPFIDEASIENSITCATIALYLGLTPEQIAERMQRLQPVADRKSVV